MSGFRMRSRSRLRGRGGWESRELHVRGARRPVVVETHSNGQSDLVMVACVRADDIWSAWNRAMPD